MKNFIPESPSRSQLWFFWAWMVLINVVLAYSSLAHEAKIWCFVVGWIVPVLWFLVRTRLPPYGYPSLLNDLKSSVWFIWLIVALGVFLRTIWFRDLPNWPINDETVNGYFAMKLEQHWTWHLFFFWSQIPPLLIWMLVGAFKVLPEPLDAIHAVPLFLSLLLLPMAYGAIRVFFERTTAMLYLALVSTGFGFLFFGRFCHQGILLLLLEFMGLYTLGRFLKAGSARAWSGWLILHGLVVGIGFYTYFAWPLVAVVLTLPVLWTLGQRVGFREKVSQVLLFSLPLFLILAPMGLAYLEGKYGSYYSYRLSTFQANEVGYRLNQIGDCLSGFLWGCSPQEFCYGPAWGGFLNPILGGFLVIGFLFLRQRTGTIFTWWFYASLLILLIPNVISGPPFSEMRVIQCLPFVTFLVLVGLEGLLSNLQEKKAVLAASLLLVLSFGLDLYHLSRTREYLDHYWNFQKTREFYKAFPILEKEAQQKGPGIILSSMDVSVFHDQSLRVACYRFNILDNPDLKDRAAHWVGLVANVHYKPFLEKDFKGARWYALSDQESGKKSYYSGGQMLAVLPVSDGNRKKIDDWVAANEKIEAVYDQVSDLSLGGGRLEAIRLMDGMEPDLSRDRLVRSCYWETLFYLHNWQNTHSQATRQNFDDSLQALRKAIEQGYPTAHFYNELGSMYAMEGKIPQAKSAFKKAIHAPLDLTTASANLALLEKNK